MKVLKCLKCGKDYDPVFRIYDSKVFCLNCESFQIKKELGPFEGLFSIGNRKDKLNLYKAVDEIKNPFSIFCHLLGNQDQFTEEYFKSGLYPVEIIRRWTYSQYLLEIIFKNKLSRNNLKDLKENQYNIEEIKIVRDKLFLLTEKAYSYDRFSEDFKNNELIYLDSGSKIELYLTKDKFFFSTPNNIYDALIQKNPFFYNNYVMECKGYAPNILINVDSSLQEWSLATKIYTDIAKFASIYPININELKYPELSAQILQTHASEDIMKPISPSFPIITIPFDYQNEFMDILSRFAALGFFLKGIEYLGKNFQESYKETFDYFSTSFKFRRIFYSFEDCYLTTSERLEFFSKLIESQYQISKKNEKRNIRNYRGMKKLEHNIWKFGFHINVDHIFKNKELMRNIKLTSAEGELEVDVVFYNDNKLEFIECKSDVALNLVRQEEYLRKMRKKIKPLKKYFESKGYEVEKIIPSMICEVCVTPPPKDIDIYLSEMHLFEVLTRRNGLFEWDGNKFFDKYPIIARLGWENYLYSDNINIDLSYLIQNSKTFLRSTTIDELINKYKYRKEDLSKWRNLDVLCIYDEKKKEIIDFIILPPYYRHNYNDSYTWDKALEFHSSYYGQRFLHIASKNGIFGFCPECLIFPLVPVGYAYKPARFSAEGICPNCNKSIELEAFDKASFHKNEELLKKVKYSFDKRLEPYLID
ncbi:MAG: hypothetical protein JXA99_03465 [Candidatus Lokiarchaeota archaeon]|nr:hypothetical protein [Candidatus Lokiarchaeota archaeon]